jgi:hypothetical protein
MPSAFVPFLPAPGKSASSPGGGSRPQTDSAATANAFAALVPGAAAGSPPPTAASGHAHHADAGKPVVTLQKDGDRVTHIRIQCTCGEVIELECAY